MQVETMKMDPRIARIHYADYLRKCREHRSERAEKLNAEAKAAGKELGRCRIEKTKLEKEDDELKRLYLQLSKGKQILNLPSVMRDAGPSEDGNLLPRLAICRANAEWCRIESNSSSVVFYDQGGWTRNRCNSVKVPLRDFRDCAVDYSVRLQNDIQGLGHFKAMVPIIPVHLRPKADLKSYHILWDAEWEDAVPVDPILLKRIDPNSDTNWVVIAQWDLTPIEQSVLEGRLGG